jgi:hypothetical protein
VITICPSRARCSTRADAQGHLPLGALLLDGRLHPLGGEQPGVGVGELAEKSVANVLDDAAAPGDDTAAEPIETRLHVPVRRVVAKLSIQA